MELQFLQTLSQEAQHAYQISQYMLENAGSTLAQASKYVTGRTWSASRLGDGLARVSRAVAEVGSRGGDFAKVNEVVAHGMTVAGGTPVTTGIVTRVLGGLGRRAIGLVTTESVASGFAVGTGAVITAVVLLPVAIYGARFVGERYADRPIEAGRRTIEARANPTAPVTVEHRGGYYAVFLLPDNSGGTLWIGDEEDLRRLRGCDTPNGGTCDSGRTYPTVRYERKSANFNTEEEAVAELCRNTRQQGGYWGNHAVGYGGTWWSPYGCPANP